MKMTFDHGEKQTVKCDFCQKEFSQLQNLNQHIAIVHNKKSKIQPSSFKNTETNSRFVKKEKSHCKSDKSVVRLSHESILIKNMNRGQENENVNKKTPIPNGTIVSKDLVKMSTNANGMAIRVVEFSNGGYKIRKRLLPKNQHTRRKLLNFEFRINGELSKSAKI